MIEIMRAELSDDAEVIWEDEELENCVSKAVSSMARIYPRYLATEFTLSFTVTDETIKTDDAALDTPISLDYSHAKYGSETIYSAAGKTGTLSVRDTDYTINYLTGVVTPKVGGNMDLDTTYYVTYTKDKLGLDISSITSGMLRIDKVEYPVGKIPQSFVSFERWEDYLYILSQPSTSQVQLSESYHVIVYYTVDHTAPTDSDDGTYPSFLDSVIIIGAEAYALQIRTQQLNVLSNAQQAIAATYLTTGDGKINTQNIGANVAEAYKSYADAAIAQANLYNQQAQAMMSQSTMRIQEFWNILRDKTQMKLATVNTPVSQGRTGEPSR